MISAAAQKAWDRRFIVFRHNIAGIVAGYESLKFMFHRNPETPTRAMWCIAYDRESKRQEDRK